jgi:hypothetical protein
MVSGNEGLEIMGVSGSPLQRGDQVEVYLARKVEELFDDVGCDVLDWPSSVVFVSYFVNERDKADLTELVVPGNDTFLGERAEDATVVLGTGDRDLVRVTEVVTVTERRVVDLFDSFDFEWSEGGESSFEFSEVHAISIP